MGKALISRWITTSWVTITRVARWTAVDGHYEVRVPLELSEVSYLDQVQLFILDHPANKEIFTRSSRDRPIRSLALLFGEARASPSQMPCGRRVRNPWFEPSSPKQRAYSSNLEVIDGRLLLETASDTTHSLPGRPTNQSPLPAPKIPAKLAAALYQDPFRILLVSLIGVDRNNSSLAQREEDHRTDMTVNSRSPPFFSSCR